MEIEQIHWFLTEKCNLDCSYCFRDKSICKNSDNILSVAESISKSGIKKVVIGGGEPLLVKNIKKVLETLKKNEIFTELHTNGTLISEDKIKDFGSLVDCVGLPIDALNKSIQKKLRGKEFESTHSRIIDISEKLIDCKIDVGFHTVFAWPNKKEIFALYDFLKQVDFSYWRIYEFNQPLAFERVCQTYQKKHNCSDELLKKWGEARQLLGPINYDKGLCDCLFAHFIFEEQKLKSKKDKRVQFVGIRDPKKPYIFLDNLGKMFFYTQYSFEERRPLGNIFSEGFGSIAQKVRLLQENPIFFDEKTEGEYIDSILSRPLWMRLEDGAYMAEELEELKPKYMDRLLYLAKLYKKRISSLERKFSI